MGATCHVNDIGMFCSDWFRERDLARRELVLSILSRRLRKMARSMINMGGLYGGHW